MHCVWRNPWKGTRLVLTEVGEFAAYLPGGGALDLR